MIMEADPQQTATAEAKDNDEASVMSELAADFSTATTPVYSFDNLPADQDGEGLEKSSAIRTAVWLEGHKGNRKRKFIEEAYDLFDDDHEVVERLQAEFKRSQAETEHLKAEIERLKQAIAEQRQPIKLSQLSSEQKEQFIRRFVHECSREDIELFKSTIQDEIAKSKDRALLGKFYSLLDFSFYQHCDRTWK
jgi:hypothetical protein